MKWKSPGSATITVVVTSPASASKRTAAEVRVAAVARRSLFADQDDEVRV